MNRRAKFVAASFILGGEIRKRTNKQTNKITNSNRLWPILVMAKRISELDIVQ